MKQIRRTPAPVEVHRCGECGKAVFDYKFENLSLDGKPTLISCPMSGRYKRVVSEFACNKFVMRIE